MNAISKARQQASQREPPNPDGRLMERPSLGRMPFRSTITPFRASANAIVELIYPANVGRNLPNSFKHNAASKFFTLMITYSIKMRFDMRQSDRTGSGGQFRDK
ncbi:MAG: hypothetical protein E5W03_05360 [Mesorhizobium sp.]|nr:MAG: hypothetical protein E5W03_05360 [Mesorhizobium sp.]TIV09707.1 MAG: hypothetical protein E5W02_21085 [Mesorhizobium sp.]